jgi:hypothetical protein
MELVRNAFELVQAAAEGMFSWVSRSDEAKTALLVLLLTPLLRFLWLGASTIYQYFLEWCGRRIEKCPINLGPVEVPPARVDRLPKEVPIYCLIIRYGSDAYLEKLASGQERFEGRTRYKVLKSKLRLDREKGSYSGIIKLKVHRRLGTQFKLFFEVESEKEARQYLDLLRRLSSLVEDASISHYGAKPKVWFLLKRFHIISVGDDSVRRDGRPAIRNNFFFPV